MKRLPTGHLHGVPDRHQESRDQVYKGKEKRDFVPQPHGDPHAVSKPDPMTRPERESLLMCFRQPLSPQTRTDNPSVRYYVRKGEANSFIK